MKRASIFPLVFLLTGQAHAAATSVSTINGPKVCANRNVETRVYIPNEAESVPIFPAQTILNKTNGLLQIMDSSSIKIWSQSASDACGTGWYRQSWVVPGDGNLYLALGRPKSELTCTVKRPPAPNLLPAIQFVYQLDFKAQTGTIPGQTSDYFYMTVDGENNKVELTEKTVPNNTRRQWSDAQSTNEDCDSIFVSYCGDGVVNRGAIMTTALGRGRYQIEVAEQCDLGAENGKVGSACSASCMSIKQPDKQ